MGSLSNISDKKVVGFVRMALAITLHIISSLIRSFWAFSIASDSATHSSVCFFDLLVRFLCDNYIYYFHLL